MAYPRPTTQMIDYPFSGGVDEKTQSELVEPGAALTVTNLRQLKNGSYQKRLGYTGLSAGLITGGSVPVGKRLAAYKDELLLTDGANLYSRSATTDAWRQTTGRVPPCQITQQSVAPLQGGVLGYDTVVANGYIVSAYCMPLINAGTSYALFCTVIDASNGAVVLPPVDVTPQSITTLRGATSPNFTLVPCGNKVILVYGMAQSTDGTIWTCVLDTTSRATLTTGWSAAAATVASGSVYTGAGNIQSVWDACPLGANLWALAYVNSGVGTITNTITVNTYNSSVALQNTGSVAGSSGLGGFLPIGLSISGNASDVLWVGFCFDFLAVYQVVGLSAAAPAVVLYSAGSMTTAAPAPFFVSSIVRTSATTGRIVASGGSDGATYIQEFVGAAGAVTCTGVTLVSNNINLDSRQFSMNGRWYCTVRPNGAASPQDPDQLFLIDLTATMADQSRVAPYGGYLRCAGNISPRLAFPPALRSITGVRGGALSSTKYVLPVATLKNATSSSLNIATLDFADTNLWQPAVLGETLAVSGSVPSYYDGVRTSEIGFFQRPRITGSSFSGAGSELPTIGYKYIAVYEQTDAKGQWHQSNVSDPTGTLLPMGGNGTVCAVRTLQVSNRMDNTTRLLSSPSQVRIVLYRTTDGGTIYFRVPNSERVNDPSVDYVTMGLDVAHSDALGAPCYAQPGIPNTAQVNVTPPSFTCMVAHQDRLFGANGKSVWFTKQAVYGEGYAFCDLFQFDAGTHGDITALASMDGSLVVFKRDKIAFVDGQGPPDNGAGGDFSPPQFIATDVGCIEPRSVVVTPHGIMFQSLQGIELLSRGRSLVPYFGARVENALKTHPVITSAVLNEAKGEVVFTCLTAEGATTGGISLTFDLVNSIWVEASHFLGTVSASSAILWGHGNSTVPIYSWLQTGANSVFQQTENSYTDGGVYVPVNLVTPWVKMSGVQGYGRVSGLAALLECPTPCNLTVNIRTDYRSDITQTRTWLASEFAALRTPPELWMTMKVQKCTAFQVEIIDASPTGAAAGTGEGPVLVGLRIEYQQKTGINRSPARGL